MEDRIYDYWVATLQDGYFGDIAALTEAFGGAKSLYEIIGRGGGGQIPEVMLTKRRMEYIRSHWKKEEEIKREYYSMFHNGISYVNHADPDFPDRLRHIPSPPYGLFVKGSLPDPSLKSVAIVGARECSEYGRVCSEYFGDRLARQGVQIISGMAWGIDGISQMAAVQAGGKSFGILGCGVDVIYPGKNARLYEMLCENGSGIISEYAPGTPAISRGFPPRNRIISGMCDVLLVVEAKAKSGTLITVKMAIEQGKSVMAVPGRITDDLSHGCLALIRDGAVPAVGIDSVLEELNQSRESYVQMELDLITSSVPKQKCNIDKAKTNLYMGKYKENIETDENEWLILTEMSLDPMSADNIADRTGLDISDALVSLSKLEIKGLVKEIAVGEYVRKTQIS